MPLRPVTPTSRYRPFPASHRSLLAWHLPLRNQGFPVRIVLTHKKVGDYKTLLTATYEPIGFTEGAPGL